VFFAEALKIVGHMFGLSGDAFSGLAAMWNACGLDWIAAERVGVAIWETLGGEGVERHSCVVEDELSIDFC